MNKFESPKPNTSNPEKTIETEADLREIISIPSIKETIDEARNFDGEKSPPQQEESIKKKIMRKVAKMLRIFSFATLLSGIGGTVNRAVTNYAVESKIEQSGEVKYAHTDQETTHLINVLAGKENLTEADKKEIIIDYLTKILPQQKKEKQEQIENYGDMRNMSVEQIEKMIRKVLGDSRMNSLKKEIPEDSPTQNFDPELYNALWKLEKKYGNPKVRLSVEYDRSHYTPATNTIYIDLGVNNDLIEHYISELSHAKQFQTDPISSTLLVLKDIVQYGKDKQEKRYHEPGSLEYNAHEVIEPKLKSELENLAPIRTAKLKKEKLRIEDIKYEEYTELERIKKEEEEAIREAQDKNGREYDKERLSAHQEKPDLFKEYDSRLMKTILEIKISAEKKREEIRRKTKLQLGK